MEQHELIRLLEYSPSAGVFRWRVSPGNGVKEGDVAGTVKPNGTIIFIQGKCYYAHRLAWLYAHGTLPPEVRCMDGDRNNFRLDNLEASTMARRYRRRPMRKDSKTGIRGIHMAHGRYIVELSRGGKYVYRSSHATREEAVQAHQAAMAVIDKMETEHG